MIILSIETSCDETALAILDVNGTAKPKFTVLAHKVASQIELHKQYGGVFPMMAKREHSRNILPLFKETLREAKCFAQVKSKTLKAESEIKKILTREPELLEQFLKEIPNIKIPKLNRIVVTVGPGLEPTLWVGINFARALSTAWNIPLVPVNHMEGHVLSVLKGNTKSFALNTTIFPAVSLLVSGGHTELVLAKKVGSYKIIGKTLDDAAGEAFDKVARMMGLTYPGGPQISALAEISRNKTGTNAELSRKNTPSRFLVPSASVPRNSAIHLPRPMMHTKNFDFSFSGLKTASLYLIQKIGTLNDKTKMEIAREFEDAVVDVLIAKTIRAAKTYKVKTIIVGGGVAANKELRKRLTAESKKNNFKIHFPTKELSTDNAVMIGIAGFFGKVKKNTLENFKAKGNMEL